MRGLAVSLIAVLALAEPIGAHAQASRETAVKAAFLPRYATYVQWPASAFAAAEAPIVVCVVGPDPFAAELDRAAAAQRIGRRAVMVRRIQRVDRAARCHVAYLAGSRAQSVAAALAALRSAPVLTVTEQVRGPERGVIHLVTDRGRVGFHIDDKAAAEKGLSISSRLLALGLSVKARS